MGVSTDGILFYGFPVDEDSRNNSILCGVDKDGDFPDDFDEDKLWAAKFGLEVDKVWEHQKKYPVLVGYHCSGEYPMRFVAVGKSQLIASRGMPEPVQTLEVDPKWDGQLREFCATFGLKPPTEFGWWLVSDWR